MLFWGAAAFCVLAMAPFGELISGALFGCPFKELTGYPCPSCGTTRSALALARFDVLGALLRYPLPTLGWIAFIGGGLSLSAWALTGRDVPPLPRRIPGWGLALGVAVVLANWGWAIATGV